MSSYRSQLITLSWPTATTAAAVTAAAASTATAGTTTVAMAPRRLQVLWLLLLLRPLLLALLVSAGFALALSMAVAAALALASALAPPSQEYIHCACHGPLLQHCFLLYLNATKQSSSAWELQKNKEPLMQTLSSRIQAISAPKSDTPHVEKRPQ